ncbi:MAG: hypothetical protein IJ368_00565, partial [Oscillospiraceae bacterium]|nr:hypothetical protein [Oscillospiraceae bacterium]
VKIIAVNKSLHNEKPVSIALSSENNYASADIFELYGDTAEIRKADEIDRIKDNSFDYSLKPLSVTEFVVYPAQNKINPIYIAVIAAAMALFIAVIIIVKHKKAM